MSSKEVYRNFIQQAAGQKKSIILWDAQRRYEGRFKSFDASGDYVILSDVTIVQPDAVMTVSEILLSLASLKIVSSGLAPAMGEVAPAVSVPTPPVAERPASQPEGVEPSVFTPSTPPLATESALPHLPVEKGAVPPLPAEPLAPGEQPAAEIEAAPTVSLPPLPTEKIESGFFEGSPVTVEPAAAASAPEISSAPKPESPEESLRIPTLEELMGIAPAPSAARPVVPQATAPPVPAPVPSAPEKAILAPTPFPAPSTTAATESAGQPAEVITPEEKKPEEGVKSKWQKGFASFAGRFRKAPAAKTAIPATDPASPAAASGTETYTPSVPLTKPQTPPAASTYAARPSDFEVKGFEKPKQRVVPPEVLAQKSAAVSTSPFFQDYSTSPGQVAPDQLVVPKKKRDLGTIVLDILIALLALIAVAIVVMGFLKIKLPFRLPFF